MIAALTAFAWAKPVKFDIDEALLKKSHDNHWVALQPVFFEFTVPFSRSEWLRVSRHLTDQQRRLLACYWYIEELESGGHHQFLYNEGIICPEVEAGFLEMGSSEIVKVLGAARKTLGISQFKDIQQIRRRLEMLPRDAFREVDDRFYALNAKDEAWKSLDRYVSKHRRSFRYKGIVDIP